MAERTRQEINDIGFRALVTALGKEDAIRFVRQMSDGVSALDQPEADSTLPSMTPDEAHQAILDMREPDDQAHML